MKQLVKDGSKTSSIENLMEHVDDPILQNRFLAVKKERKQILADYIKEHNGIEVDVDSILMFKLRDYMHIKDNY